MSKLKILIYLYCIYFTFSQKNFPMMPNPGYDSITSHPIFDVGNQNNSIISSKNNNNSISTIMTNGSITVNTTNMDPQCNLECYTGCLIYFPELINQKYCIINVCKCQIIEKEVILPDNIKNNSQNADIINSEIHKYSTTAFINLNNKYKNSLNLNDNLKNEDNYYYWIFYILVFIFSLGYEYYIWNYISEKNDFSIVNWINEKNDDIHFKKYRVTVENEIEDKNNNDDELRRCLL